MHSEILSGISLTVCPAHIVQKILSETLLGILSGMHLQISPSVILEICPESLPGIRTDISFVISILKEFPLNFTKGP